MGRNGQEPVLLFIFLFRKNAWRLTQPIDGETLRPERVFEFRIKTSSSGEEILWNRFPERQQGKRWIMRRFWTFVLVAVVVQ